MKSKVWYLFFLYVMSDWSVDCSSCTVFIGNASNCNCQRPSYFMAVVFGCFSCIIGCSMAHHSNFLFSSWSNCSSMSWMSSRLSHYYSLWICHSFSHLVYTITFQFFSIFFLLVWHVSEKLFCLLCSGDCVGILSNNSCRSHWGQCSRWHHLGCVLVNFLLSLLTSFSFSDCFHLVIHKQK